MNVVVSCCLIFAVCVCLCPCACVYVCACVHVHLQTAVLLVIDLCIMINFVCVHVYALLCVFYL